MAASTALRAALLVAVGYAIFLTLMLLYGGVEPSLRAPGLAPPVVLNETDGGAAPGNDTAPPVPRQTVVVDDRARCTNFYEAECDLTAPSMFSRVYEANEQAMLPLVRASGTYTACLETGYLATPAPASPALGAWLQAGALLPLRVEVETALDRPAQVLSLTWDAHLYGTLLNKAASLPAASRALDLFPLDVFSDIWMHRHRTTSEDDDLDAYTARYLPWPQAAALLPGVWREALEAAFPEALGTPEVAERVLVWQDRAVTPEALTRVAAAWQAAPAATHRALHEAGEQLLWAAAARSGYRALETLWSRQALRGPVPNPGDDTTAAYVAGTDASDLERACHALAEVVERPGLNQAFLAATGLADGERTADVADLVVEVAHAVAALLHEHADHLETATRNAAIAKLEQAAVYVLGPSPAAVRSAASLDALPAGDLAGRVAAWRQQTHARAARQLATPHAAWRRHMGQHLAHTVRYATVNAWYQPVRNAITVPPGILQAPVFVAGADHRSERLAHVGMILAHELGHSLDVHGRLFDAEGCLVRPVERGWWTEADAAHLDARMGCLAADYGHPCGRADYGLHTIGEDTADQLGLRASYALLVTAPDGARSESERSRAFFEAYARLWCARTPSQAHECAQVERDVHALPQHRVNKSLRQLRTFAAAYGCSDRDEMVNSEPCLVY